MGSVLQEYNSLTKHLNSLVCYKTIHKKKKKDDSHQSVKSDTTGPGSVSGPFKSEKVCSFCIQHKEEQQKDTLI